MHITGIDGSPSSGGRTQTALRAVLAGAAAAGADTRLLSLTTDGVEATLRAVEDGDAFVFGSPVYRGSYAWPLKTFLDRLPRGIWGEVGEPIRARAAAIVLTGASWHHFLALNDLRNVLAGFFAAHVLTPGLYLPADAFASESEPTLKEPFHEAAHLQGMTLVDLATAVSGSRLLGDVRPQA